MCFSNLPIEFDANGDPYLADEAEAVERSDVAEAETNEALDTDPQEAYEVIVGDLPQGAQERLAGSDRASDRDDRSVDTGGASYDTVEGE